MRLTESTIEDAALMWFEGRWHAVVNRPAFWSSV